MKVNLAKLILVKTAIVAILFFGINSCKKETAKEPDSSQQTQPLIDNLTTIDEASLLALKEKDDNALGERTSVPINLNVLLFGKDYSLGYIRFRQPDTTHIIYLDTWVFHLKPNRSYQLQRAVDSLDHNCTSTSWLTLGKGSTPQSIHTDKYGNGFAKLFRNVSGIPSGSKFDIHFQIIDSVTSAVALKSGCYQYMIR